MQIHEKRQNTAKFQAAEYLIDFSNCVTELGNELPILRNKALL